VKEHDVHVNVKMPAWMVQMIDARRKEGESRSSTVRRLLLAGIMEVQDD
jgi:Arc/MetJ-type ribon-helix-helix transcriptional regulator